MPDTAGSGASTIMRTSAFRIGDSRRSREGIAVGETLRLFLVITDNGPLVSTRSRRAARRTVIGHRLSKQDALLTTWPPLSRP